jgi:hypothetical protein
VLDATRMLPPPGRADRDVRPAVVAGADIVAVDAYATRFFGSSRRDCAPRPRASAARIDGSGKGWSGESVIGEGLRFPSRPA